MGGIFLLCFHIILMQIICNNNFVQTKRTNKNCVDCDGPLYLTPLIERGQFSEARKQAEVHHEDFHVPSYSGFLRVEENYTAQMFFWYFPSLVSPESPLVLWLGNAPTLNGIFSIFQENGPFIIINGTVTKRDLAWNNDYHLLYLENPVGTGFSHTPYYDRAYNRTAENLYSALLQFLLLFSELQQIELYIFGSSYGAKYAVNLCDLIHHKNQNRSFQMNLQGFALFSGIIDPINQMDFAINLYNAGLLDQHEYEQIHALEEKTKQSIKQKNWMEFLGHFCGKIHSRLTEYTGFATHLNIRKPDEYTIDKVFERAGTVVRYLHKVRTSLHVGHTQMKYGLLNMNIFNDQLKSVTPVLSKILNHYRGIVVTGQLSFIVSYHTMNNVLNKLEFSSSDEWRMAKRSHWYVDGKLAGYYKTAGNLTEIMALDAGHMIVADQPERAYDILRRFTGNQWK